MTLRKYWTEIGFLTAEEYREALGRWPGCRECGFCDPAEVARGALSMDGLCGECESRPEPEERDYAAEMAEEEFERRRDNALFDTRAQRGGG